MTKTTIKENKTMLNNTETYNGWSNHSTWDFYNLTQNDYNIYGQIRDIVLENINNKKLILQVLRSTASDPIHDCDYYNINFNEISDSWIEETEEEIKEFNN